MKNLIFKLFLIVVFGWLLFTYAFPWAKYDINVPFTGNDYKLGLDLQWGIELDYRVDLTEAEKEEDYDNNREKAIIEGLKSIIDKRVESLNINDSIITSASYAWEQHIIVQIPLKWNSSLENSDNIERAKAAIWKVVKIEFKEERLDITDADRAARIELAASALNELQTTAYDFFVTAQAYKDGNEKVDIGTIDNLSERFQIEDLPESENGLIPRIFNVKNTIGNDGSLIISYNQEDDNYDYLFIDKEPSAWKSAQDAQGRILNDKYFVNSSVQYNEAFQPMVELTFNSDGADIFGELTKRLIGEPIAIFVWGELLTSPTVNDAILTGRAVVTGNYTPEEANKLSQDINTWVVPAPIYLTSERTIDSRLGLNSLQKLLVAGLAWFALILLFLLYTYRLAGLIAAWALFIYIVLVLAVVKSFGIVLTLASIAGLILSIGMAIDANILIFERVRAEIRDWKDLEKAVKTWFDRSWSAIWDSNVTGFIVAIILFIFGINMIKWFGLILAIWILVSLFSVMFISRVFIVLLSKNDISLSKFIWMKKEK